MARRRKGNAVNGWIVLDKRAGMTSTQAVGAVRRLYNAQKAGHAGTLDPLATGILPIALGEATKTVSFAVDGEKAYRFTVRWGAETNTDDAEGSVHAHHRASARRCAEIEAILPRYIGAIMQTPPQFSAIKIDGNRAYDLAREGETVALEPREVVIDALRDRRHARRRHHRVRGGMRPRHLCARDRPRHRPRSRLLRPRDRAAPHARRPVPRGRQHHARGARRGRPRSTTAVQRSPARCSASRPRSQGSPSSTSASRTRPHRARPVAC